MPFDNPHQAPFGDIELLREARSRISSKGDWVQGRFRDGHRECLVAALSVVSGSRPSICRTARSEGLPGCSLCIFRAGDFGQGSSFFRRGNA